MSSSPLLFTKRPLLNSSCVDRDTIPGRKKRCYVDGFRRLCRDHTFLPGLRNYDKDNIPDKRIKDVEKIYHGEDLDPVRLKKFGAAAGALGMWAMAIFKYHLLSRAVDPYREAVYTASSDLQGLMAVRDYIMTVRG